MKKSKNEWNLDELFTHIEVKYNVVYQPRQSYYDLFLDAGISWKKSQKINPKTNPGLVKKH